MPINVNLTNTSGSRYTGRNLICKSIKKALRGEGFGQGAVEVILVSDADIRKLHKTWMGKSSATDVITFPIDTEPPIYAEIYISVETARRQAKDYGVSLRNELCRLAVHGALHLAGYDDGTPEEREAMHKLENRYIKGL